MSDQDLQMIYAAGLLLTCFLVGVALVVVWW